jgi:hypothetical protein
MFCIGFLLSRFLVTIAWHIFRTEETASEYRRLSNKQLWTATKRLTSNFQVEWGRNNDNFSIVFQHPVALLLHHSHKSLHKISYIKSFNFLHKVSFSVCAILTTTLLHIRYMFRPHGPSSGVLSL